MDKIEVSKDFLNVVAILLHDTTELVNKYIKMEEDDYYWNLTKSAEQTYYRLIDIIEEAEGDEDEES